MQKKGDQVKKLTNFLSWMFLQKIKKKVLTNYSPSSFACMYALNQEPLLLDGRLHCKKKIGDVLIVSEQVQIICRSIGIRIAQFAGY